MKVRLRYFTFLLKNVAVCKFDLILENLWFWKSIWLFRFSFCFSLEFAYATAVVRVIAKEMFFFQAANMLHGCLVHIAGSFRRLQIVRSLFYSAGGLLLPDFRIHPVFMSGLWASLSCLTPRTKEKEEVLRDFVLLHHGDLQVCTAASPAGSLWSLLPLFPLLTSPFHVFSTLLMPLLSKELRQKRFSQNEWSFINLVGTRIVYIFFICVLKTGVF